MTAKEYCYEVLNALGESTSYVPAQKWLRAKYGKGMHLNDASFYLNRKLWKLDRLKKPVFLEKLKESLMKVPEVKPETQIVTSKEVTFTELKNFSNIVREIGGINRMRLLLGCLEELKKEEVMV